MEWYVPITIIPAVSLLILSTSNMLLALNVEIGQLENDIEKNKSIILLKLKQLRRLSVAMVFQYISVLLFLLSGIWNALFMETETVLFGLMLAAVVFIAASIVLLLVFAIRAVSIRQQHLGV